MKKTNIIKRMAVFLLTLIVTFAGIGFQNEIVSAKKDRTWYSLDLDNTFVSGTFYGTGGYQGTLYTVEENFYKVSLPSDGWLTITCQGLSIGSCSYDIYDEDGENLLCYGGAVSHTSDISPKTSTTTLALAEGVYSIGVETASNYSGDYKIKASFTAAGNDEGSRNHNFESARELKNGEQITGFLSLEESVDFYKIDVPSRQSVKMIYTSMIKWSDIRVWNYDRTELYSKDLYVDLKSGNSKTDVYETTLDPGIYFIGIYSEDSSYPKFAEDFYRGRYKLQVVIGNQNSKPKKMSKPKLNSTGYSNEIYVSFNSQSGVDGYEVQYSRNKNFKSAKRVRTAYPYLTISQLSRGKRYYFRVRAYINGGSYGAWSGKRSIYVN